MAVVYQDVVRAADRIRPFVHQTPVLTSALINEALGANVFFKCENFQKVGAFKARGAINAVAQLTGAHAVATHSSGNHGAALAYAAGVFGLTAHIVMPSNAPAVKKAAVAAYGGNIVECEPTQAAREATAAQLVEETGACFVPPYDHAHIIAGQGTAALELISQVPEPLEIIMAPVGGGGLLAGTALAAAGVKGLRVIGAEPAGADDAARGFKTGVRVTEQTPNTIADGLRTLVGVENFAVIKNHVHDILTVSEAGIIEAMALVWSRLKIVIEASAAVPVAAILEHPEIFRGARLGVILSGGNVELTALPFAQLAR
ncbi:pyridoxal-phosphate dependent enzyme [Simiduia sp. 21SJ11W-1]|uniref:pyridoxal-phosphate dependent enzyme n=1 Tax=Simiduia sp. 21SJ11W-1 TaxID=2909669 RepID=UPI0020A1FE9F|nr:pyridoxal-phosphate dependent enzyme [Simiduia sp. 21SJ11W-1]UTA47162.1 pyridoxal-phosphate dependent enzyme [Simiduia sp. 21SJ11W-1]